jgi:hypothetical protein
MRKTLLLGGICLTAASFSPDWGFFAHQRINRLAVFTLPAPLIGFYKKNIDFITETSVNPDKRRYAVADEAPRHYLDVDHYGDSALSLLPHNWDSAVSAFSEDTLKAYGILPWHVFGMYLRLRDDFAVGDPARILRLSAELGHYVGDAHVPLHTTENYNGQLTGQEGIHGLWESRLPELFSNEYDFFVGQAEYIQNPQAHAWSAIASAEALVDRVLAEEKKLGEKYQEKKYAFETRGKTTVKVYASEYARAYHDILSGMVEQQMRAAIKMTGDLWFTAWVDAGQPDMLRLIEYKPSEAELRDNRAALEAWKAKRFKAREP